MSTELTPAALQIQEHPEWVDQEFAERSLWEFTRQMWPWVDPSHFRDAWHIGAICELLEAVSAGEIRRLLINIPPRCSKSSIVSVMWPAWSWIKRPELSFMASSYAQSLSTRDSVKCRRVIDSPPYKQRWGDRFKLTSDQNTKIRFDNDKHGYRLATSVGGALTGEGASCIVVDDPINVVEASSETVRRATLEWWDESMSTRLNDPETGAYVIIMQRCHHQDLSGHVLEKGGWEHLCLPARYEQNHPHVSARDRRSADGELLCPERFSERSIRQLETDLGTYGCTPGESPVLMADLSLRPISEVKVGDKVAGFAPGEIHGDAKWARTHLQPTTVTGTTRYPKAQLVKLRMESGEFARCTPDHLWYRKMRRDHPSSTYCPANAGSPLVRVCPSHLPELHPEDERIAGWLCGFYEADGSVSFVRRNHGCRPVGRIVFYQGAGRNGPLCYKLEQALKHFGFEYSIRIDERKDTSRGVNFEYRAYTLLGKSLPLFQRFIHIADPIKWKDRMIETAYGARFGSRDRVESIEPDGFEDVFALQTETGNYVVWGLCSSNSAGQLQQRPAPRVGGMFDRDWWQFVDAAPAGGEVVRGWDLAASTGKSASWTAGLRMKRVDGVFYIEDVARFRGTPGEVEKRIGSLAAQDGPSVLIDIPQDPGQAGKAQVQYMVKQLAGSLGL